MAVNETPADPPELVVEGATAGGAPQRADGPIRLPARHNPTLQEVIRLINADAELHAVWKCANVNAVDRLGMSDHGPVHVQIVANIALKLLRLLASREIVPSVVLNHEMSVDDAEVIVVLACLLHDSGLSIHRDDHERYSLFI